MYAVPRIVCHDAQCPMHCWFCNHYCLYLSCSEERLFAYGQTVGDTEVTDVSAATLERASQYLTVPYGLPLFGEQVYNSIYVSCYATSVSSFCQIYLYGNNCIMELYVTIITVPASRSAARMRIKFHCISCLYVLDSLPVLCTASKPMQN